MTRKGAVGLLLVAILLAGLAFYYHGVVNKKIDEISQLRKDLQLATATVNLQARQFQLANDIAASVERQRTTITAEQQEKEIVYRTILNVESCADQPVPVAIANRLLDYTHRLRSRTMSGTPGQPDNAGASTFASGTLTYQQAVLWLDPLLSTIDEANGKLLGIREAEASRAER